MKAVYFEFFVFMMFALMAITSCGNKTNSAASDADSAVVNEVPDTLNTIEAVEKQVNAVYQYWNELREHYDENKPTVDERFGSKEWQQVRNEVLAIDRECECGGFFDFGEEGPLDPWTYDCYEGYVSANDIQVKLQPNGMAEVRFLVKDAVTIKGIPMRWLMQVEDGQWRVANIFFEKDDNFDILMGMRDYAFAQKPEMVAMRTFVEQFYEEFEKVGLLEYGYLKQHITPNLLKFLADSYEYDCEGECLATWLFFYEGGGDVGELKLRHITVRDENHVLVESRYVNYEYDLLLTMIKDGDTFKIDSLQQERSKYIDMN